MIRHQCYYNNSHYLNFGELMNQYENVDEFDLAKIINHIKSTKLIILGTLLISLLISSLYIYNTPYQYQGQILIELGELLVTSKNDNMQSVQLLKFEKSEDLKEKLSQIFFHELGNEKGLRFEVPRSSDYLIKIYYQNSDVTKIATKLNEVAETVLSTLEKKSELYKRSNIQVTKSSILGEPQLLKEPVSPAKLRIFLISTFVGLFLGLLFSIITKLIKNES